MYAQLYAPPISCLDVQSSKFVWVSFLNAWGSIAAGEYLKDHRDVPLYMSIVLMIPMMALIVLSAYLGFKYGDKKIKKEHEDFLRKHADVSND